MINIKELTKAFGANEVLRGIDLSFDEPGITAVLGPNGSGKTTLIKSVLGMVIPDQGVIEFAEKPIKRQWEYRDQINYLPQIARFPENLKGIELFRLVQRLRERTGDPQPLIERFELELFLHKKLGTLSGGTRQKMNIALAFMYDSPVLILDEPTTGLDPVALIELKNLIKEERSKGKIILCTTHIMSFVEEMAERVVFLLDGKIHYNGSLSGLLEQYHETNLEAAIASILQKRPTKTHLNGNTLVPKTQPILTSK